MTATSSADIAIVTSSFAGDLERCRLLCETIDRHVTGFSHHYLLVAGHDVKRFRPFEGRRRSVVDERDLLPRWLHALPDPFSLFSRHVWIGPRGMPLRGWHIQQLRRIAIAAHVPEAALLSCDSDVVFVKPFDCASLWLGERLRFLRRDGALERPELAEQRLWSANAGRTLGLGEPSLADYIGTVIGWRRDAVLAMCAHIERTHSRSWVAAIAARRAFSECMLYGRFVDEILGGDGHAASAAELCRVYWDGPALDSDELSRFVAELRPEEVAIGLQSFIGMSAADIRRGLERF